MESRSRRGRLLRGTSQPSMYLYGSRCVKAALQKCKQNEEQTAKDERQKQVEDQSKRQECTSEVNTDAHGEQHVSNWQQMTKEKVEKNQIMSDKSSQETDSENQNEQKDQGNEDQSHRETKEVEGTNNQEEEKNKDVSDQEGWTMIYVREDGDSGSTESEAFANNVPIGNGEVISATAASTSIPKVDDCNEGNSHTTQAEDSDNSKFKLAVHEGLSNPGEAAILTLKSPSIDGTETDSDDSSDEDYNFEEDLGSESSDYDDSEESGHSSTDNLCNKTISGDDSVCNIDVSGDENVSSNDVSGENICNNEVSGENDDHKAKYKSDNINDVQDTSDGIKVQVSKTIAKKRDWGKCHYCCFCGTGVIKISRHLLSSLHKGEPEVTNILAMEPGSKERKQALQKLVERGDYKHNYNVLKLNKGELVVRRRIPVNDSGNAGTESFSFCRFCKQCFKSKFLWKHGQTCHGNPNRKMPNQKDAEQEEKKGKARGKVRWLHEGRKLMPTPAGMENDFKEQILDHLKVDDPVTSIIWKDDLIQLYGRKLFQRHRHRRHRLSYVRERIREIGRVVEICRKGSSRIKGLIDLINPGEFQVTKEAVQKLCIFDESKNTYLKPNLVKKIGPSLQHCADYVEAEMLKNDDNVPWVEVDKRIANINRFRRLCNLTWSDEVGFHATKTVKETNMFKPKLLPSTKNIVKLNITLQDTAEKSASLLRSTVSSAVWNELCKSTLVLVTVFNRKRQGEASRITMEMYSNRITEPPNEDVLNGLSKLEKELVHTFTRIEIEGKFGRTVPIVLTPTMKGYVDLLVETRVSAGVAAENQYLFARPYDNSLDCQSGAACLRQYATRTGLKGKDVKAITSTKLRKHLATTSTVLNLTHHELDQLATFMGHNIDVHRDKYRLPENVTQVAKVAKWLMCMDKGNVTKNIGRNLDTLSIDPDECLSDDGIYESSSDEERVTYAHGSAENDKATSDQPGTTKREHPTPHGLGHSCPKKKAHKEKATWSETEQEAINSTLGHLLLTKTYAKKCDAEYAKKAMPEALKNRTYLHVKYYVNNKVAKALKNMPEKTY